MEKKIKDKKEMILDILKKDGERSLTEIGFMIKANHYRTKSLLSELKKESKIENIKNRRGNYWKIRRKND